MHDLRFAFRQLLKNPGFTAVAVLTLALGIGANTAIFSVVNQVLLRPLPYDQPERLVTLWERSPRRNIEQENVSPPNLAEWREQSRSFENIAFWTGNDRFNVLGSDGVEKVRCSYASSSLFPVLRVSPIMGRAFLPEEDLKEGNRAAIISHEFWKNRFGARDNVLGQTITVDTYGRRQYEIVGVMPPGFGFPNKCDIWLPAGWNGLPSDRRGGHWLSVIARLKSGVTVEQAAGEMNSIQARIEQQHPNSGVGSHAAVVPLLEQTVGRNLRLALFVLWVVVACVLLIACANVANLLLAFAAARQKEIAIRLSLGASRWRITRQLLTESVLLAVFGGVLGLILAHWSLRLLVAFGSSHIPRLQEVSLEGVSLAFTFLVAGATGVLFGLAPAWQFSNPDLNDTLKDSSRGATGGLHRSRLRSSLIVAEIALSLMLLIGAGLMTQSFVRLTRIDRGFQTEHILTADIDFSVSGFTTWIRPTSTRPQVTVQQLIERVRNQPGVQSISAVSGLPRGGGSGRLAAFAIKDQMPGAGEKPSANFTGITPDYFRTMGIPLLRGRMLSEADTFESPAVAIINETLAKRYFPGEDPIGKRLALIGANGQPAGPNPQSATPWSEVVGVVADTKNLSLRAETVPDIFVPYWQWPMQGPTVIVRTTGDPGKVAAAIRGELKALNPNLPAPAIRMMDEILAETVAQPRFHTLLLGLFGGLALVLSAVGIYGVMAYGVSQRTHEIGIRMALGAQKSNVLALVIGQGMRLAVIGVSIGILAALALTRVMRTLLYEITPTDPLTFIGVSVLLALIALLACWIPARRAAKVDPMVALRHE
jgi:predicted permease